MSKANPSEATQDVRAKRYNTTYRTGQQNVRLFGLEVHNPVFFLSSLLILSLIVVTIKFPDQAATSFEVSLKFVTSKAGWLMGSLANFFVLFGLFLILSPYGGVRLGGADARPDFKNTAWFAMLFAAGMGIGLVFYSVGEPISHFTSAVAADAGGAASYAPLGGAAGDPKEAARIAMATTIFHWTLHPWAIYAVVAISLGLFAYNYNMPLTIRSAFYPLFGERIWGASGHVIDALAIIATVAGLATSLGLGAQQALAGVNRLFGVEMNATNQIILVLIIALITSCSLILGLETGVKCFSELNMAIAALLCIFVVVTGPTEAVLAAVSSNFIALVEYLPSLANVVDRKDPAFFHDWTIFYWAWWTAWAPFVGMFIARISRGRTVREIVVFVTLLPSLVSMLWFTAFGTVALEQIAVDGYTAAAEAELPLKLFFVLERLPFSEISSFVGIALVIIFFVTSWDSGALVLDTLSAGGKVDTHKSQRLFWLALVGGAAIALLLGGGLRSLQSGSVVTGLPFMLIIAAMCVGVIIGLRHALAEQQELRRAVRK